MQTDNDTSKENENQTNKEVTPGHPLPPLPRSFTQTSMDFTVVDIDHDAQAGSSTGRPRSLLRGQDSADVGTFMPLDMVLRTLGSPLFYRVETYELTPYGCVIFGSDDEGREVTLIPGSSLVDALLLVPPKAADDSDESLKGTLSKVTGAQGPVSIHFLGKVLDRIALPTAEAKHLVQATTGYIIRFSQMSLDDQEKLRDCLMQLERSGAHQDSSAPS